jgi:hypothetical protein
MFAFNVGAHFRGCGEAQVTFVAANRIFTASMRHNAVPLDGGHQLVAIRATVHPGQAAIGTLDLRMQIF